VNGTTYYYVVAADYTGGTDGSGNSANSTEASATAIVPTPTPTSTSTPGATPTPTPSATPSSSPTSSPTSTPTPSSTATPTPAPTPTLAHWWQFDDGAGPVAADSADSAPGALSGSASWVAGVDEQYAVSVGTSSYNGGAAVSFPTTLPTTFTFSFWVDPNGYTNALGGGGPDNNVLFGGDQYLTNGFRSGFTSAGIFGFWTTESGGTLSLSDTTAISAGVWTWFAVTYSNNSASLYRNGNLVATASGTYIPGSTNLGLDAGVGGVDFYWGSVDDTRIYNSALSSSAILTLYQSMIPVPTPTPG
jgi:concanavalin A-like lectin/glucanase superfamily protein